MFEEMKAWLSSPEAGDYQFGYDDPYVDYLYGIYGDAEREVGEQMNDADIFIEPSVQSGMGGVFMTCKNGSTSWDFESECETLAEYVMEAESKEELKNAIVGYLLGKYEDCVPEEDDDDDEDPDYEGSPDEDDED